MTQNLNWHSVILGNAEVIRKRIVFAAVVVIVAVAAVVEVVAVVFVVGENRNRIMRKQQCLVQRPSPGKTKDQWIDVEVAGLVSVVDVVALVIFDVA